MFKTIPLLLFFILIRIFVEDDYQRENLYLQNRPPTLPLFHPFLIFVQDDYLKEEPSFQSYPPTRPLLFDHLN